MGCLYMITIYKYELNIGENKINIPADFKILKIDQQENKIYMWAQIDTNNSLTTLSVLTVGTGFSMAHDFVSQAKHIETLVMKNSFVWHFYQLKTE